MAQRLISSFFTKSDASKNSNTNKSVNIKSEKTEEDLTEESPVKLQKRRVIKQVSETDEESNGCDDGPEGSMQRKSVANELNEFNSNENIHTNGSVKIEVTSDKNNLTNGTSKTKRKKTQVIESDDDEDIASTKKVKLDEEKETEKESSVFILKRKTARKGLRSAPIVKIHASKNSSSSSEESDSESSKLHDQDNYKISEDNKNDDPILPMDVDVPLANTEDSDSKAEEILNEKDNKTSNRKDFENLDSSPSDDKAKNIQICHDKKSKKNAQSSVGKMTSKVKSSSKKKDKEGKKSETDVTNEEVSHNLNESSKNGEASEKYNANSASSSEKSRNVHPFFKKEKSEQNNEESSEIKKNKQSSPGTSYNPSKNKYHPVNDACWKHEEKIPYLALAKTLQLIEDISGRLKMIEILSNFLRSVIVLTPNDFLNCINLCLNRLAPEYEGIKKGVGDDILIRAVAGATAREVKDIKAKVAETGDLGLVAESSRVNQRTLFAPPKLTVSSVFTKFKEIANMSGSESRDKKTDKIKSLLVACRESEARFIVRSLSGKLRIGLAEQSVLAAIARAVVLTPPGQSYPPKELDVSSNMSAEKFATLLSEKTLILKTTYCECSNYDVVIPALLKEGIDELPKHCQLQPGCPLKPMLAHPTNGVDEVLKRFDNNEFTCEFKYDGERAQIHMTEEGEIRIFSRNQEDSTSKYPDVLSRISKALKSTTKSFILDTEAVAWDREAQQILPFQVLSTRKKKDAVESEIVVQVCIMAFDLIYLNGESLVRKTLKERRDLLHSSFVEIPNEFAFVTYRDGNNSEAMQEFLSESVKGNCEGLMVKALTVDASYEIAKRSHNWLKLKKDYLKGVGDTLDLVVIGGYHGKGKRKGTYGGFLLACYDSDNEELQSICKLGTGFTEKDLDTLSETLKTLVIPKPKSYYRYDDTLKPDHWFNAEQIWEIKCADLSISPIHKAALGLVDPEKGISLRFPRFIRIREDKTKMEDSTDALEVARMYQSQDQVKNTTNKNQKTDEYY